MTAVELKNNFHHLIDSIDNEKLLQQFYELTLWKRTSKDGKLWNNLSKDEVEELLQANEESENPDNLISHDDVKEKYAEWL